MHKFEQAPNVSAEEQERKDQIQIIAETKYAEQNSGEYRTTGLPKSED